jgi:hypothetical protein
MRAERGEAQYPDANSTMRITYGRVGGLEPYDGVVCASRSTVAGLLEKNNPALHDFSLPGDFLSLLQTTAAGDRSVFLTPPASGPLPSAWVHVCENTPVSGPLPKCINFLTDNDITGGNSGSPVLNARGELVGLAFDGNKESLASNFSVTEGYNKCVCVDIRYILWILKEYAHLDRIVAEMGVSE